MGWPCGWSNVKESCYAEKYEYFGQLRQDMPAMRGHVPKALGRAIDEFSPSEILRDTVRETRRDKERSDSFGLALESPKVQKEGVRGVRTEGTTSRAPHRPGQKEQHAGEYPDAMRALPQVLARYGREAWGSGCWEDAIPRVAQGVAAGVDRLKCIGNGQVPAVAALAWETLIDRIASHSTPISSASVKPGSGSA